MKTFLKILRRTGIALLSVIVVFTAVCAAGRMFNRRTPDGGINEAFYTDINGTKQWVSIYGQDRDNPVLLYMHGGPFASTSWFDWCTFRKLSADAGITTPGIKPPNQSRRGIWLMTAGL